ncbi:hypothetical protein NL108_003899 [Boleophthalmus pectinirostris]|nr:hypothetical protein NL108_003899 [Boleophthalmus pectinirostris]
MLYHCTTLRTGSDRGAVYGPPHFRQVDGFTGLQKLQVLVGAAIVVTAIRARSCSFPQLLALPTELIALPLISSAHRAHHTQVSEIFPLNITFTSRTLREQKEKKYIKNITINLQYQEHSMN